MATPNTHKTHESTLSKGSRLLFTINVIIYTKQLFVSAAKIVATTMPPGDAEDHVRLDETRRKSGGCCWYIYNELFFKVDGKNIPQICDIKLKFEKKSIKSPLALEHVTIVTLDR